MYTRIQSLNRVHEYTTIQPVRLRNIYKQLWFVLRLMVFLSMVDFNKSHVTSNALIRQASQDLFKCPFLHSMFLYICIYRQILSSFRILYNCVYSSYYYTRLHKVSYTSGTSNHLYEIITRRECLQQHAGFRTSTTGVPTDMQVCKL